MDSNRRSLRLNHDVIWRQALPIALPHQAIGRFDVAREACGIKEWRACSRGGQLCFQRGQRIAVVRVAGIEASHVSRSARLHYYARLDGGAAPLPPGRYFLGRYDEAWEPPATSAPSLQIVQVSVRYRTGLLGARTLLEVVPAGGVMQ